MARYIEEGHIRAVAKAFTNRDFRDILDEVLEHTDNADVQPVVHGKWMYERRFELPYCSVCHELKQGFKESNFCPNCGARMDEDNS